MLFCKQVKSQHKSVVPIILVLVVKVAHNNLLSMLGRESVSCHERVIHLHFVNFKVQVNNSFMTINIFPS